MNFQHPSERSLGGDSLPNRPGLHLATGQRCYCFSSSKSATSSSDQRATATDNARSQSGTKNVQASDKATVVAVGDGSTLSAGNISAGGAGSTVTVGVNPADVSQLIGGLVDTITQANSQQLQAVTDALKPKTEDKSGPGDPKNLLLVTALAVGGWLIAKDK